jgi:hypothetical protein
MEEVAYACAFVATTSLVPGLYSGIEIGPEKIRLCLQSVLNLSESQLHHVIAFCSAPWCYFLVHESHSQIRSCQNLIVEPL